MKKKKPVSIAMLLLLFTFHTKAAGNVQSTAEEAAAQITLAVDAAHQAVFSVTFHGQPVISDSPLGLCVDNCFLGREVSQMQQAARKGNEATYLITQANGRQVYVDTRSFNDGIALRYRIPTNGALCIYDELTTFHFPSGTKVWYASGPFQYGWLQQYQDRLTDSIEGELLAPPATFRLPQGTYAALTEANLFNYHGAVMFGESANQVRFGYVENKGHVESGVITGLPAKKYWHEVVRNVPWIVSPQVGSHEVVTPWRVLMLARDLNELVNNGIMAQVCDQPDRTLFPQGIHTEWIKPGRASFTWLVQTPDRLSIANHKKYIDGCSQLGIETVVVDDGWELWPRCKKPRPSGAYVPPRMPIATPRSAFSFSQG